MVEVSLTVGKLDASLALLLTKDHHLIEFPTILLPNGVKAGSIIKIKCDQDFETEKEEARQFQKIQDEILHSFGQNLPQPPVLKIKNVTQTSCVLEWEPLELGTANLKNLILFKDGKKLGAIPQPLTSRTTKLSGLPIDKTFQFQLRFDTTAGVYPSEVIEVTTHKMTDLLGITACLGDISPNEQFTVDQIQEALKNMGAHYPTQDKIKVDTTHFICTRENKSNPEYIKASEMNIPIVRPEWLKACERERRIVGVRDFYVKDCVLPDLFAKNYWERKLPQIPPTEKVEEKEVEANEPKEETVVNEPTKVEDNEEIKENPVQESESVAAEPESEKEAQLKEIDISDEPVALSAELEQENEAELKEIDIAEEPVAAVTDIDPVAKQEVAKSETPIVSEEPVESEAPVKDSEPVESDLGAAVDSSEPLTEAKEEAISNSKATESDVAETVPETVPVTEEAEDEGGAEEGEEEDEEGEEAAVEESTEDQPDSNGSKKKKNNKKKKKGKK